MLKKIIEAAKTYPEIGAAAFLIGLVIGCVYILVTHPEMVRLVMFGG